MEETKRLMWNAETEYKSDINYIFQILILVGKKYFWIVQI